MPKATQKTYETAYERGSKETAERFAERLKGEEHLLYGATKEIKICNIRHELIDEICKEIVEGRMDNKDIAEQAYKKGYEQGVKDFVKKLIQKRFGKAWWASAKVLRSDIDNIANDLIGGREECTKLM